MELVTLILLFITISKKTHEFIAKPKVNQKQQIKWSEAVDSHQPNQSKQRGKNEK